MINTNIRKKGLEIFFNKKLVSLVIGIFISINSSDAKACTAFNLKAKNGDVIASRTMEWALDMQWSLIFYPEGYTYNINGPEALKLSSIKVRNKYAILGIGTGRVNNSIIEGQNSAGLGFSANFLPGFTEYQVVDIDDKKYISILDLGKFILGNFSTIKQLREELSTFKVWEEAVIDLPVSPMLHLLVTDSAGEAVVIEFIDGKMIFFDTPVQVMTNAPNYDWHLINIRNYLNLSATSRTNIHKQYNVTDLSQGGGGLGLPGSFTSTDRFVKICFLKYNANIPVNSLEAIELCGHILSTVDIPKGVVNVSNGIDASDYTQWIAIKDLTNNMIYFADYDHRLNFVAIDLKKVFKKNHAVILPIGDIKYPCNDGTRNLLK